MTKITVHDNPYAGHATEAMHVYYLHEGIYTIFYSKETKNVVVTFDSCRDVLQIPVDDLTSITIERD